jgi:hypothetical protein
MMRTSESKGHWQLYDSSAVEPEVRSYPCRTMCANFGFAALGVILLNARRVQVLQIDEALGCGKRRLDRFALGHQGNDLFHAFEVDLA